MTFFSKCAGVISRTKITAHGTKLQTQHQQQIQCYRTYLQRQPQRLNSSSSTNSQKLTSSQRQEVLRDANEKMKFYYENRPSLQTLNKSKRKFLDEDHHYVMAGVMSTFLTLFLISPFLGKKIAKDAEFREKYIPKFYDYSVEKPDYAWSRAELHEQMVALQMQLHKRAIDGEFTPEKLEEMRRHFDGVNPEEDENGWGKIHPGVDDDEDIEED